MRNLGRVGILLTIVLSGCSSSPTTTSSAESPSSSSTPSSSSPAPTPKGPPTAQLTFVGDAGLAGAATKPQVSCDLPDIDGTSSMNVLIHPPGAMALFNITITSKKILVLIATSAGVDFRSRSFEGTGLTGFDAATGVKIDTRLTETTAPGTKRGTLGKVTSVKGSVDCGNQTTGMSSVTITGSTAGGAITGTLSPFVVRCFTKQGRLSLVSLVAVASVGTTKARLILSMSTSSVQLFGIPHAYSTKAPGIVTLTSNGSHINGDIVEQAPTGKAHTLHVEGDLTCGATVSQ